MGDIASCASNEATANLLDGIDGAIFTLGDNVYEKGTSAQTGNDWGSRGSIRALALLIV